MTDPFRDQILDALAGPFDPNVFEACAIDLLRKNGPHRIVHIHGGQDAGFDGAVGDGEGPPFPLVCTVQKDVIGNLLKSLKRAAAEKRRFDKVILATSQELTAAKRRKLEDRARELGSTLLQTYDRQNLADLLYHDSRWCQELLNLSGQPCALSAVISSRRPFLDLPPIGRDQELEWLRQLKTDAILVGEPGSGKTFLIRKLVDEGWGLFLNGNDSTAITNALRDLRPRFVVIDDAHLEPERIDRLRQLRGQTGHEFSILATTWPSHEVEVRQALVEAPTKKLELLPRRFILEIFQKAGIEASDEIFRELLDQAGNKPGLAATIAYFWRRGEWQGLLTGEKLADNLLPSLARLVDSHVSPILGCLALGGAEGLPSELVREFLELNRGEFHQSLSSLAAAGVLKDRRDAFAVEPEALRTELLRRIFFSGRASDLPFRELFERAPKPRQILEALAKAGQRWRTLPPDLDDFFQEHLLAIAVQDAIGREPEEDEEDTVFEMSSWRRQPARNLWESYAWIGDRQATWAFEAWPVNRDDLSLPYLEWCGEVAIQRLFAIAPIDQIRSALGRWLIQLDPRTLERRTKFRTALEEQIRKKTAAATLRAAFFTALDRSVKTSRITPTGGHVLRLGVLPRTAIPTLKALSSHLLDLIDQLDPETWLNIVGFLDSWWRPSLTTDDLDEWTKAAQNFLGKLAPKIPPKTPLASEILVYAARLDLQVESEPDEEYSFLTSADMRLDPEKAARLAERWLLLGPQATADRIRDLRSAIATFHSPHAFRINEIVGHMAKTLTDAQSWLDEFRAVGLPARLCEDLLVVLVRESGPGVLAELLDDEELGPLAAKMALSLDDVATELRRRALERVEIDAWIVQELREVPIASRLLLLNSSNPIVAENAAVAEWYPGSRIRPELDADWRRAIVKAAQNGASWALGGIFHHEKDLGFEWLLERIRHGQLISALEYVAQEVVLELPREKRLQVVEALRGDSSERFLVKALINEDLGLFASLLARQDLQQLHLVPLEVFHPDSTWLDMARLALEHGHEPRDIENCSYNAGGPYSPGDPNHWLPRLEAFESLAPAADTPGLKEVIECGKRSSLAMIERANRESRRIEMSGMFR